MLLVDHQIRMAIQLYKLVDPFTPEHLQPASVDLTLGNKLRLYKTQSPLFVLDAMRPEPRATFEADIPYDGFVLPPGKFVLGTTAETVKIPNRIVGRMEGKSSLGRLGLIVHVTAGFFDPGFCGQATLELFNLNQFPIRLYAGMRIAQMSFLQSERCERPYGSDGLGSKYQNQQGPTPSGGVA